MSCGLLFRLLVSVFGFALVAGGAVAGQKMVVDPETEINLLEGFDAELLLP
jgi:hypothetical protein